MRPRSSFLGGVIAAMTLGALGGASAATPPPTLKFEDKGYTDRYAKRMATEAVFESIMRGEYWMGVSRSGPTPPASWHKKNQRQIRLARRRRAAGGDKKAFR